MNNQEPELNPAPTETESAKTNESAQTSGPEIPVDERPSYLRKSPDRVEEVQLSRWERQLRLACGKRSFERLEIRVLEQSSVQIQTASNRISLYPYSPSQQTNSG